MNVVSDFILGTAQLGQAYGIANRTGMPDAATARAIVATAWKFGIRAFDTAPSYGSAERFLGAALKAIGASSAAEVTSKLDVTVGAFGADDVRQLVMGSCTRLGAPRLHGLLIRRALLSRWSSVAPALTSICNAGIVEHVGVSVYAPHEALSALALPEVAFVQVPTNMLDRRFLEAGVFDEAQALGKRVVVRSILLQGLLTMQPEDAPTIPGAREALQCIRRVSNELGMAPFALALAYVRERCPNADILVGAETPEQVAELTRLGQQRIPPCAECIERYVPAGTPDLVDPTRWHADIR